MTNLESLKIIECKYCYAVWEAFIKDGKESFSSSAKEFTQRRDVDLYHECGVYHTAGVPFIIEELEFDQFSGKAPYAAITRSVSDAVCEGVLNGQGILMAGGYCNYAPAIIGGLQRAVGIDKKIGVVWIDAHSDNQIVENFTEPIRLVGVPVTTFLGQTLPGYRKDVCGLEVPIDGRNMIISDARITLSDEDENLRSANVVRLTSNDFENSEKWKTEIEALAERVDTIYLSVDADILKPEYIPAYEVVSPGGHNIDRVMQNIAIVMSTGKVNAFSVFCVDFDHYDQGGEWTYLTGMKLIASGLHNWKQKGI